MKNYLWEIPLRLTGSTCAAVVLPNLFLKYSPRTSWQHLTTCVCGWSMATSKPRVCSKMFSFTTSSCALSKYACMSWRGKEIGMVNNLTEWKDSKAGQEAKKNIWDKSAEIFPTCLLLPDKPKYICLIFMQFLIIHDSSYGEWSNTLPTLNRCQSQWWRWELWFSELLQDHLTYSSWKQMILM